MNGEIGYGDGYDDKPLPFFKNFYAGGISSVRGYEAGTIGPKDINGDALGGNQRYIVNAELLFPVPGLKGDKSTRMGVFFDAGAVRNDQALDLLGDQSWRYSAGLVGFWVSPFGPLKFAIAQALNAGPETRPRPSSFRWVVHYDSKNGREEIIQPRSRTFIPALASQNPYTGDAYIATLQKLPEPMRSALLYGDFSVSLTDQPLQLFPSDWVRSATLRHSQTPMPGYPGYPPSDTNRRMTAIGADIARGGADTTVLILRYGQWFAPPVSLSKAETADGPSAGAAIVKHRRDQAQIVIEANGVGASVYDHLRNNAPDDGNIKAHVGSVASTARGRSNRYGFTNRRSEVYWKLREALDPVARFQNQDAAGADAGDDAARQLGARFGGCLRR